MKKNTHIPLYTKIQTAIYIISILLLLINIYGSNTTVYRHTGVYAYQIVTILLLFSVFIKFKLKIPSNFLLSTINLYVIFPISFLVGLFLVIWGYISPPNYVYSLTHLQAGSICLIALFSAIMIIIQKPETWIKKHYKKVLFATAILSFLGTIVIYLLPFDVFAQISKEDNIIENLQVVILLIAAFFAFKVFLKFYRSGEKINAILFLILVVFLIFVAGDEISWGQRIFGIHSPTYFMKHNDQKEITIHNLTFLDQKVNLGYIIIGLYGAIAWLVQYDFHKLKRTPFQYYVPPWYASSYYFLGFAYNLYTRLNTHHHVGLWSEFMELMIYSGIMITIFSVYLGLRKRKEKSNI